MISTVGFLKSPRILPNKNLQQSWPVDILRLDNLKRRVTLVLQATERHFALRTRISFYRHPYIVLFTRLHLPLGISLVIFILLLFQIIYFLIDSIKNFCIYLFINLFPKFYIFSCKLCSPLSQD